ncbi:MAG: glycosyltransferase family 4 protein [Bacteroidales bacterium]|nr:glycosyltransferase family 4 protein [Bacteroidales bacterium]
MTLVIWKASMGGIEKSLTSYLSGLGSDFSFTLYSLRPVHEMPGFYHDLLHDFRQNRHNGAALYIDFLKYLFLHRHHIFHLFNAGPLILLMTALLCRRKVVYHIRGTVYWKKSWQKPVRKMLWRLAGYTKAEFIANSKYSRSVFNRLVLPGKKVRIIYNPIDVKFFAGLDKTSSERIRISYIGRLVEGKNLHIWIDCAKYLLDNGVNAVFRMTGDGPLRDHLEEKTNQLGISSFFRFDGFINQVEKVYRETDVVLFLSEYESFGNIAVEAIVSRTPIIASSIPSMKEIFMEFPEFLVDLDRKDLFEQILLKVIDLESLKKSATEARELFIKRFRPEEHLEMIRKVYLDEEKSVK